MNLDKLTKNIRKISKEQVVQKLANHIQEWKTNEKNALELRNDVERYLGNTWIDNKQVFEKVYETWSDFKNSAIDKIGGMTMNERLYWFALIDQFDKASSSSDQDKFYKKLMAKK